MMFLPGQLFASRIAWRNEPGPSSSVVVTVMVMGQTVTVKLHWFELPEESAARHVTVVLPRGNVEPLGGMQLTIGVGSQLSPTTGAKPTTREPVPGVSR